jgi:hypothetical protein
MTISATPDWKAQAAAIAESLGTLHLRTRENGYTTLYDPELTARLSQVRLSPARVRLLHDHATPTLRKSFNPAADENLWRKELLHAFKDGIAKSLSPLVAIGQIDLPGFEPVVLESLLTLDTLLGDLQHNYALILEDTAYAGDAMIPAILDSYGRDMRPRVAACAASLADAMGLTSDELATLKSARQADFDQGWEHVRPLPSALWRSLAPA